MEGWLKLHRTLLESKQFLNPIDLKIWVWLLCKVSTRDRNFTLKVGNGLQVISLQQGQMIFGRTSAEQELDIGGSTIYKVLQRMATNGSISIVSNNHFSIITLPNWSDYQCYEKVEDFEIIDEVAAGKQRENSKVAATGQQSSSHGTQCKKVKKEKKVKKVEKVGEGAAAPHEHLTAPEGSPEWKKFFDWVEGHAPRVHRMKQPFTEKQFEEMKREWPPQATRDILLAMQNYPKLHTNNLSSYLTAINWLKRDQKNATHRQPAGAGQTKPGASEARINALRNWGNHRAGSGVDG